MNVNYDDPLREQIAAEAIRGVNWLYEQAGESPLSDAERGALSRRVRPSVLSLVKDQGMDSDAGACALRFVAFGEECNCGGWHLYADSWWTDTGRTLAQLLPPERR